MKTLIQIREEAKNIYRDMHPEYKGGISIEEKIYIPIIFGEWNIEVSCRYHTNGSILFDSYDIFREIEGFFEFSDNSKAKQEWEQYRREDRIFRKGVESTLKAVIGVKKEEFVRSIIYSNSKEIREKTEEICKQQNYVVERYDNYTIYSAGTSCLVVAYLEDQSTQFYETFACVMKTFKNQHIEDVRALMKQNMQLKTD